MREKHIKLVQIKNLFDAPYKSNVNTVAEEHVSSENIHFDDVCC